MSDVLEKLLLIDESNLKEEWKNQPILYMRAVREYAAAVAEQATDEQNLNELEGRVLIEAKKSDAGFRVTDIAAKNMVESNPEVKLARQVVIQTAQRVNILKGLVRAFEQRAQALYAVQQQMREPMWFQRETAE